MKLVNKISRILVGSLFIFSGLIKLNDPWGTAYKLEEYFEVFGHDFGSFFLTLIPFSLTFSLIFSIMEIVLGIAVLINYRMKITAWILLLLILFFTFLTFYSAYFNKVTDCGCFGDFLKLTPWTSFSKDIILLAFILLIFFNRNKYNSIYDNWKGDVFIGVSTILLIIIGNYSLAHLPFIDFLPYKTGNNIPIEMKAPEAPKYKYVMVKDGKSYEFENYPTDTTYKMDTFLLMNPTKIYAKITDYSVYNDEGDYSPETFKGVKLMILVQDATKALKKCDKDCMQPVVGLIKGLEGSEVKCLAVTSSGADEFENFRHEVQLSIPYYYSDATVLKTMIRSNPGIMLLKDGTVLGKWHVNDTPDADKIKAMIK